MSCVFISLTLKFNLRIAGAFLFLLRIIHHQEFFLTQLILMHFSFAAQHRCCHTTWCIELFDTLFRDQITYHMWWCVKNGWMFVRREWEGSEEDLSSSYSYLLNNVDLWWSLDLFFSSPTINEREFFCKKLMQLSGL